MNLRQQLLVAAQRAAGPLGASTDLVRAFLTRQLAAEGAGLDRAGRPDLYYTTFVLAGLEALAAPWPRDRVAAYLETHGDGADLDLVHASALARAWGLVGRERLPAERGRALLRRLEAFRRPDGGYDVNPAAAHGTAYGAFLALGAYEDLGRRPPQLFRLARALHALRAEDGAWSNVPGARVGTLTATAGAAALLRRFHLPVPAAVGPWLLAQAHPRGGFLAVPGAPLPDLLSTATALHALAALGHPLPPDVRERTLDFVDSLWDATGGFHGHWADDALDAEYTFYGLLALGHLQA